MKDKSRNTPSAGNRLRKGAHDGRPARREGRLRTRLELVLLLGPALVFFCGLVLLPILIAGFDSLHKWEGFGPIGAFIGLANYVRAITDTIFQGAILHNLIYAGLSLLIQLPLSLGLALLLNRNLRGQTVFRLIAFAPYILSEAITAVTWLLMLQPGGFVDVTLNALGLGGLVHQWLADTHIVLYTLFVVITWKFIGFGIILFLAGLQGIPTELREAAVIDGASSWRVTRSITIPLLGPTIRIWIFLAIIGSLQVFTTVWIMTLGGPANASTTMVTYMIDRGFRRYQFGYGSAIAVILFIVCFVFALLYQRFVLSRDTRGGVTHMVGA